MRDIADLTAGVDLKQLILNHYPDAYRAGKWWAVWRGDSRHASLSVYHKAGKWRWKDFATDEGGDALDFLVSIVGMTRSEAVHALAGAPIGVTAPRQERKPERTYQGPSAWTIKTLEKAQTALKEKGLPRTLGGRGITADEAARLGFGRMRQDTLIPLYQDGELWAVKRRISQGEVRYKYLDAGCSTPPWYSPNYGQNINILVCEGELNAATIHLATNMITIGMAGASVELPNLDGRNIYLLTDNDKAGKDARERWAMQAAYQGLNVYQLAPLETGDACDLAGKHGKDALRRAIELRIRKAPRYQPKRPSKATLKVTLARKAGITNQFRTAIATGVSPSQVEKVDRLATTLARQTTSSTGTAGKALPPTPIPIGIASRLLTCHQTCALTKNTLRHDINHLWGIGFSLQKGTFSASEFAEYVQHSISHARKILKTLTDQGIFTRSRDGRAFVYQLSAAWRARLRERVEVVVKKLKTVRFPKWFDRLHRRMESFRNLLLQPIGSKLREKYGHLLLKGVVT